MLTMPKMTIRSRDRVVTDVFRGYHHALRIADGELFSCENLSSEQYPLLATRKRRGIVKELTAPSGMIAKDALCYVDNGTLFVNHLPTAVTSLGQGEKQLVSMGAYVCIFPDKVYYNTEDPQDFGSMEAVHTAQGSISFAPCNIDGQVYDIGSVSGSAPSTPANGEIWIDTSEGEVMMQWSAAQGIWTQIPTVYTKITFASEGTIPSLFAKYDGVEISGAPEEELNGSKCLFAVGGKAGSQGEPGESDYIVVIGLLQQTIEQQAGSLTISRTVPSMDYVCEAGNRLWGCFYGNDGEKNINEIYCCALGDFKNWRQYQGLSTDSWAAGVGSDGQWTGAANYLGHPVFFKETRIHMVTISSSGAHRIDETVARGVQKGSWKSLQVVAETLYYKSRSDVCAWQGGFPQSVSEALGEERYYDGCAGAFGSRYYISMRGDDGKWNLFVYDIRRGLWMREDELHVSSWAAVDDELFAVNAESGELMAMNGTEGELEDELPWEAETGILHYDYPDKKRVSRYDVRLQMEKGSRAELAVEYDSDGIWRDGCRIEVRGTGTAVLPIRPRRCDHLRLRIRGTGETRIFSIARVMEVSSDD